MASSRAPDDGGAELARLKTLCDALRGRLSSAIEAKQTSLPAQPTLVHGGLALIQLKEVHRSLWEVVHAFKEATQRANAGVDAAELKLQNLQYEKNHFLRQITHLRDFHPDAGPKIEMLNEEEFAKQAPPELLAVSKADDPHQYHLNRLELELRQRKALCEVCCSSSARLAAVRTLFAQLVRLSHAGVLPLAFYSSITTLPRHVCTRRCATRGWLSVQQSLSVTLKSKNFSTVSKRSCSHW